VEKLKQFAFDLCTVGEMKVTACTPHAGKQSINSAVSQDIKPCCALLRSIDVCCVFGPARFVTLIACISIQHAPGAQAARWVTERRGGMQGGEGKEGVSKHGAVTVHRWSNSAPLSRQNCLRLISDAWIWISKGWKTNMNLNLKFEVRKSEFRLTTLLLACNYYTR